nr:carbohydrate kinase [Xylella fastidiosa]RWA43932.1 carbohydrate kinase [Xylella fastidiosa subsp. sandyi]
MSVALSIDLSKKKTILCFGEALIDMLAQPLVKKGMPRAFLQCAGGAPANVAVAVARLGGAVQFVGMLGSDMFGDFLFDSFAEAGVVTDGIVRTSTAKTALAFVALDAHGERSFSFYRPPAADLLFRVEHFQDASFSDALIFHACSNSMTDADIAEVTFEGMRRAQAAGAIVSFDLNFRPMLWPNGENPASRLWKGLSLADVVKLSSEELDYLANTLAADANAVIQQLWQGRAQLLLVTDAAGPVHWYTRTVGGQVPTFRVQVQDSNAAGDAFVGGMLYTFAQQFDDAAALIDFCHDPESIASTLRFAAAVGALAVTRQGAFTAMPMLSEVLSLIQEQS